MNTYFIKKLCVFILVILTSIILVSCNDDDDAAGDPMDGLIDNQTPYQVKINFMGIKIIEIAPGVFVRESTFEEGKTYQIQVTVLDDTGNTQEVINSSVYIDKDADKHIINNESCSWYIRIWGESVPFSIESGS